MNVFRTYTNKYKSIVLLVLILLTSNTMDAQTIYDKNGAMFTYANKQNANKLKSIFISNSSFYLLQLKGCHERHLLTIYAILIKKAVNAWFVGKNIGKKMGRDGAALTIV